MASTSVWALRVSVSCLHIHCCQESANFGGLPLSGSRHALPGAGGATK